MQIVTPKSVLPITYKIAKRRGVQEIDFYCEAQHFTMPPPQRRMQTSHGRITSNSRSQNAS